MYDCLLEVHDLEKRFKSNRSFVHAVNGVDLMVHKGQTLGIVGESGCGKSTLALLILRLYKPDFGKILFEGKDITDLNRSKLRTLRRQMQIVFQNPYSSLNPRMKVGEILEEPLLVHRMGNGYQRRDRVYELLEIVGLGRQSYSKFPHEFSGGQRQRIGIARALALNPKLIVADEPVSSLDVSVRGEILNLFVELQRQFDLTYIFISHDLKVIEHVSDRIAVMYLGRVVEEFDAGDLDKATHPYTRTLISAVPIADPFHRRKRIVLKGEPPSPLCLPSGCSFHERCKYAQELCSSQMPILRDIGGGHQAACHFYEKVA